jgi:hypothetical protein
MVKISNHKTQSLSLLELMDRPTNEGIEEILEKKFISPSKFAEEIEKIVSNQKIGYIDAIIIYCENNNVDVESVPKLISKPLKEKIKYEAMELNFLKKTSRAKLIF